MRYNRGVRICTAKDGSQDFYFTYDQDTYSARVYTPDFQRNRRERKLKTTSVDRTLFYKVPLMTLGLLASWAIILTGALA